MVTRRKNTSHEVQLFKPEFLFLFLYLFASLAVAILLPQGGGADEPSHIARIDQISRGEITSYIVDPNAEESWPGQDTGSDYNYYGGLIDKNLINLAWTNMLMYQSTRPYPFEDIFPNSQNDLEYGESDCSYIFSNTSVNTPIVYLPQLAGYTIMKIITGDVWWMIIGARIAAIIFFAVSCFFLIRFAPIGKWALTVVMLMPQTIAVNAVITADSVTIICVISLIEAIVILLLKDTSSPGPWILLGICVLSLGLLKMTYILFAPLILMLLARKKYRTGKCIILLSGLLLICFLLFFGWYSTIHTINTGAIYSAEIDPAAQTELIIHRPLHFLKLLLIGIITTNYLQLGEQGMVLGNALFPINGIVGFIVIIICLVANDSREIQKIPSEIKSKPWLSCFPIVAFLILSAGIETALFLQFSPVDFPEIRGVQSRYFIAPLAMLFFLLATWKIPWLDKIARRFPNITRNKLNIFATYAGLSMTLTTAIFIINIASTFSY